MTRAKKTRVKSAKRVASMAERWKDPAYAAKMREAAKRGAATANAKRKTTAPPSPPPTDPAGSPPAGPPAAPPPTKTGARTATRSYSPGRAWR